MACKKAVEILGCQGRMLHGQKGIFYNTKIYTPFYGILWYGDLAPSDHDKVVELGKQLNTLVQIVHKQ